MSDRLREIIRAGAAELGLSVAEAALDQFSLHFSLLRTWNRLFNLTGLEDAEEAALKHFLDALTCLTLIDPPWGARVVDIGSGAGFPGLPLQIVRPDLHFTLLEANAKKAHFLEQAVRALGLARTEVLCARAEEVGHQGGRRESYHYAVSRAVAELRVALEYALPLVVSGGFALFQKGPRAMAEIAAAGRALQILQGEVREQKRLWLPRGAGERVLVLVEKKGPTPPLYPRRPGVPNRRPL
ncbi:MAG: 16S rRNA (guanine(527)-N(7))-methyltransferase RsmG [Bacillota bacterium]|nr:16S rRNA (guanine(527)-N(7))-methyltransferase RsmG [Bacillota bacterium]